jgi:hypothetical protein
MDAGLKRLGAHVENLYVEASRRFPQEALRRRFLAHGADGARRPRRRRRPIMILALGLAGAVAVALAFVTARPPALTFEITGAAERQGEEIEWITAPTGSPVQVAFSDGSRLALTARARVRVLDRSAAGARVVLERGRLGAEIVHRHAATSWRIEAGPFEVQVVGTRFDLAWDPASRRFDLSLRDGQVRVTGPRIAGARTVDAGEHFEVDLGRPAEVSPPARQPVAPPADTAPSVSVPRRHGPNPERMRVPPAWRSLAAAGRFDEAWASIAALDFDGVVAGAGAGELALVADVARFSGHAPQAAVALHALRERFPFASDAADVSFLLGRLAADQRHDPAAAVEWLTRYLRERPDGAFAAEAAGRLIECRRALGDDDAARAAARHYLASYPAGSYAALARRVLDSP